MVEQQIQLDLVFGALSDATRRGMLASLRTGELSVGQLAEPYDMSLAGAAKHVQVLQKSGLIKRRKVGRSYVCSINEPAFVAAKKWLKAYEKFWNDKLDSLTAILEKENEEK